jgi:hypothetical protein
MTLSTTEQLLAFAKSTFSIRVEQEKPFLLYRDGCDIHMGSERQQA